MIYNINCDYQRLFGKVKIMISQTWQQNVFLLYKIHKIFNILLYNESNHSIRMIVYFYFGLINKMGYALYI